MAEPTNVEQLRRILVERGRSPYTVLTTADLDSRNPEAAYVLRPLPDGRVDVSAEERGAVNFHRVYDDEPSAVADLARRLLALDTAPSVSEEHLEWSRRDLEQQRLRMLEEFQGGSGGHRDQC